MTEDHYEPVSCDYHDQLEAASMHQQEVELEFELEGVAQKDKGRIADVYTANGAEFIRFSASNGPVELRLDQIISMREE